MSRRRREHVTGESGELAVAAVWTEAGAAVDFVHRDYGEDLLVQTALDGELDASRLWVQVKTRSNPERFRLRSGDLVLRVGASTAVRWIRSADLAVVVLWDPSARRGWWAVPQDQLDELSIRLHQTRTVALRFEAENEFGLAAADRLAWMGRIHHISRSLAAIDHDQILVLDFEDVGEIHVLPALGTTLTHFLEMMGVIVNGRITDDFQRLVYAGYAMAQESEIGRPNQYTAAGVMFALLAQMKTLADLGIPRPVLLQLINGTIRALEQQDDFVFPESMPEDVD